MTFEKGTAKPYIMEDGAFQAFLKRGRYVAMIIRQFGIRRSGRDQRLFEEGTAGGVVLPLVASAVQAEQWDADAAVVAKLDAGLGGE